MTTRDDIQRVYDRVNGQSLLKSEPGDYAELEHEDQPDGLVVLRRKSGQAYAWIPRDVWDAIREPGPPATEPPLTRLERI